MKNFKTGDLVYVRDNSYIKNLTTGKDVRLAGTIDIDPVQVKVVSKPYKRTVRNIVGKLNREEFIKVEYNGEIFRVLNNLTTTFRSAEEFRRLYNSLFF
jgi:hypothetical protein